MLRKSCAVCDNVAEINSCGDMNTVDVIFPTSPLLLYTDPSLLRMLLLPILDYANNGTYINFTDRFSPHQLGVYPVGDSTTADQELMPLENTGNMFLMLLGIVQQVRPLPSSVQRIVLLLCPSLISDALFLPIIIAVSMWMSYQDPAHDTSFFYPHYWPMLVSWADELASTVQYPANQICTDDFTGALANNTNLGAKGVIALEAFAQLCERAGAGHSSGDGTNCSKYSEMASEFATTWQQHAYTATPQPHYKMSFNDLPGIPDSWSLKYNLIWQRLLGMGERPFPLEKTIAPREVAYYKRKLQGHAYGTPLDPRHNYTKSDWLSWAAALSASDADFRQLFDPIWLYANQTEQRHPLADLYNTVDSPGVDGKPWMYGRPVVGGFFARALLRKNNLTTTTTARGTATAAKSDDELSTESLSLGSAAAVSVMPHLEIPTFEPTYNLSRSTLTQLCFGPTPLGGEALSNETGQFLRKWGVIEIDFESEETQWAHHVGGKDADVSMLEQASQIKAIAPESHVWIYRYLVRAPCSVNQ